MSQLMGSIEEIIKTANSVVSYFCHLLAIVVILSGVAKATSIYARDIFTKLKSRQAIQESRLEIGHAFSLALAFLIGASILKTTLAPTWTDLGQLATIIAIRVILNLFLIRDIEHLARQNPDKLPE